MSAENRSPTFLGCTKLFGGSEWRGLLKQDQLETTT